MRRSFVNLSGGASIHAARGLKFDLVILDERAGEPSDQLRKELEIGVAREMFGKSGGVFFLNADKVQSNDAVLLAAAARAVPRR